jgi:uncharacterized membrane protein YqjE
MAGVSVAPVATAASRHSGLLRAGPRGSTREAPPGLGIVRAALSSVATRDRLHTQTPILASEPTSTLLRQTIDETKELVRLELALAREELSEDLQRLKIAAILGSVAIVLAVMTLSTLVVALVLWVGGTALGALAVSVALAAVCAVIAVVSYKNVPRVPLERTRARLTSEVRQFEEHIV